MTGARSQAPPAPPAASWDAVVCVLLAGGAGRDVADAAASPHPGAPPDRRRRRRDTASCRAASPPPWRRRRRPRRRKRRCRPRPRAPPAPPRPPAPSDPRRLIGLTQERIQAILGPADFVRRDGPAQIWRYDAEDCSLDVFLFREGEMQRVTHVASRARKVDAPDIPLNACYARVLGVRRGGPSG